MAVSIQEHLRNLNPEQLEAVQHFEGPILVLAGAGTGKTRVLTRRVANLVLQHGVKPQNILAVTFTNKATQEMRERLKSLMGEAADALWVSTFHAAGLKLLRRHANLLGYTNDFVVYDDQDSKSLLKRILKECDIEEKKFPLNEFARAIDFAKNNFISPEEFSKGKRPDDPSQYFENLKAEVYGKYQAALLKASAMDFGDLLMNAVALFKLEPEVLSYYQQHIRFVLVDEYQDTNKVQYMFVEMLTRLHRNLLVVGDDDQSIYAFRGASIANILNFERDFSDTKVVTLEQNYRSTEVVLEAAHSVIERNSARKKKKLWTNQPGGNLIRCFEGSDELEEAQFIAASLQEFRNSGAKLSEAAIFYRINAQSRALEEALIAADIPYRIFGGMKFYERREIKDILAYLKLLLNQADDQSFLRIINTPARGIGAQSLQAIEKLAIKDKLSQFSAAKLLAGKNKHIKQFCDLMLEFEKMVDHITLSELIYAILERTKYVEKLASLNDVTAESRIENLQELGGMAMRHELQGQSHRQILSAFLDRIALTSSDEAPSTESSPQTSEANDYVSLMTLHLAKGLEFPRVYLSGFEEGLLPHYRAVLDGREVEEERRLCYVGITRAMRELYITRAFSRGMFSFGDGLGGSYREPSRFLFDISPELIEEQHLNDSEVVSSELEGY
ncbi:MAG: ATP-dependent DNA helicase PcrA [Proteobacteria bacterium]|nr:MAG: ATP-dependent DNA helicase PcrA [Pseudomonadota bacterium]